MSDMQQSLDAFEASSRGERRRGRYDRRPPGAAATSRRRWSSSSVRANSIEYKYRLDQGRGAALLVEGDRPA